MLLHGWDPCMHALNMPFQASLLKACAAIFHAAQIQNQRESNVDTPRTLEREKSS